MTRETLEKGYELQRKIDDISELLDRLESLRAAVYIGSTHSPKAEVYLPDDLAAMLKPTIRQYWEDRMRKLATELAAL